MIADDFEERADAVLVMEEVLVGAGIAERGHSSHNRRLAEKFARDLILVSNHAEARDLIGAYPKEASAFLSEIIAIREKLESRDIDVSTEPRMPLQLYAVAADAVIEAIKRTT